jgi:peptide/nickel transport system ATP-binding protein
MGSNPSLSSTDQAAADGGRDARATYRRADKAGGEPLLRVEALTVEFRTDTGLISVVSNVSFKIEQGRTFCLVGESGCGKSVTALSILGLLEKRRSNVMARSVRFEGLDLRDDEERNLAAVRGRRIGMIFQEPMTSLNPTMTVGEQIAEVLRFHLKMDRRAARARTIELLERVRIANARQRIDDYPFAFSGGMRQRVMIALALACTPSLLIADEPTTALDVTIQAEIFDLLRELQRETGTALLLITHDLGIVAEMADEVAVMYAGRIVERSSAAAILETPEHPYTVGLLGALPQGRAVSHRLTPIDGRVPLPAERIAGCRFAPRCPFVVERCRAEEPALAAIDEARDVACWRAPLEPLQ